MILLLLSLHTIIYRINWQSAPKTIGLKIGLFRRLINADKAIVKRLVWSVLIARRVRPAPAGLQHMNDPRDHAPVIDPRNAARIGRQMRLNLRELIFRQPEKMLAHQRSPIGDLESRFATNADHFLGPDPNCWSYPFSIFTHGPRVFHASLTRQISLLQLVLALCVELVFLVFVCSVQGPISQTASAPTNLGQIVPDKVQF